jgi:hypothetical protein
MSREGLAQSEPQMLYFNVLKRASLLPTQEGFLRGQQLAPLATALNYLI